MHVLFLSRQYTHISPMLQEASLLFTNDNVIQHELGRGETAFKWHKQAKQALSSHTHIPNEHSRTVMDDKTSPEQPSSSVKDSGSLTDKDSVSSDRDFGLFS